MKIRGRHSTIYRYDVPVWLERQVFRLRPRVDGSQRLLSYELDIHPTPAGRTECLDQDGNVTTHAWFAESLSELRILNSFEVETLRENPFDFLPEEIRLPYSYADPVLKAYACGAGTPQAVTEFGRAAAEKAEFAALPFLAAVNGRLFESFRHVIREEGPPLAPEVTLAAHEGSCRDLAVLFCDLCRAVGIAARFVSGYEWAAAEGSDSHMHAWTEVYLPGAGWRGYDPSLGLAVSTSHVPVAAARIPSLAAPVTGSFRGSSAAILEANLELHLE